ncbi:hypothetical protein NC651_034036 [Populus alba x Populus x berolinensis]|nr:hypothetical protein NC651_034036 [Populus alba x Populus x berolinensis]
MLGNESRSIVASFKLHAFLIIRSLLAVFELKKRGVGVRRRMQALPVFCYMTRQHPTCNNTGIAVKWPAQSIQMV